MEGKMGLARDGTKLEDLMDVLSNHIIDIILENPKKYLLKPKMKGGRLKERWITKSGTP